MKKSLGVILMLLVLPTAFAGTWIDSFDDSDFWEVWTALDGTNNAIPIPPVQEANGRLGVTVEPGSTLYLSAGQFDGDIEFQGQFTVPPLSSKGRLGLLLRPSPAQEGGPVVYARLDHTLALAEYAVGNGQGDDTRKTYMAIASFTFQLVRTAGNVVVSVAEDEDALAQIGESFALPEGPVEALLEFAVPEDADTWKVEVEEVFVKGPTVLDMSAQAGGEGEETAAKEGKPFKAVEANLRANSGFRFLRDRRMDEALQEYQIAAQLAPKRYNTIYITLKDHILPVYREKGADGIKDIRFKPDSVTIGEWLGW